MKVTNADQPGERGHFVTRGLQTPRRGGRLTVQDSDETTEVEPTGTLVFDADAFTVTDLDDETALVSAVEGIGGSLTQEEADALYLKRAGGEGHAATTINAGAAETLDLATANTFDRTLTANCTITLSNPSDSGVEGRWTIVLRQDATGSRTVTWPASVKWRAANGTQTATAPTLATAAGAVDTIDLRTLDGGVTYGASLENGSGAGGAASPLTTKGDLWGYDTADARVPVGTDDYVLVADSTDAQGVAWRNPDTTGHYEVLMTGASPAEPLENGSGTDWLYVWVP